MTKRLFVGRTIDGRYGINTQTLEGLGSPGSVFYDDQQELLDAIRRYDNRKFYIQLDRRLDEKEQRGLIDTIKSGRFLKLLEIKINGKSLWRNISRN